MQAPVLDARGRSRWACTLNALRLVRRPPVRWALDMGLYGSYKAPSRRPTGGAGAPVAQLDRASDFESESRPFESGRAYRLIMDDADRLFRGACSSDNLEYRAISSIGRAVDS